MSASYNKIDFSELFEFESVTAVYHPQINDGAPIPCFRAGKITDLKLSAWINSHFISFGEYIRQQENASTVPEAEALNIIRS